jgi:hypothetical protein
MATWCQESIVRVRSSNEKNQDLPVSIENSSLDLMILYCTAKPLRQGEGACCACERMEGTEGVCVAAIEKRRRRQTEAETCFGVEVMVGLSDRVRSRSRGLLGQ